MNLQEMVVEATSGNKATGDSEDTQSASELLKYYAEATDLLAASRRAEKILQRGSKKQALEVAGSLAARFSSVDRSDNIGSGPEIFCSLIDFISGRGERSALLERVRLASSRLEAFLLVGSSESCLSFLDYIWEDRLEEKLARFTNTDSKTVARWIDGTTNPSLQNSEMMVGAVTVLYQLHRVCGMSKSDTCRYFEKERFGHSDDRRLRHLSLWEWLAEWVAWQSWPNRRIFFPREVSEHIVALGGDSEVFDCNFRHRFIV